MDPNFDAKEHLAGPKKIFSPYLYPRPDRTTRSPRPRPCPRSLQAPPDKALDLHGALGSSGPRMTVWRPSLLQDIGLDLPDLLQDPSRPKRGSPGSCQISVQSKPWVTGFFGRNLDAKEHLRALRILSVPDHRCKRASRSPFR